MHYLTQPVWGKGVTKERDARRFHPFPWDKKDDVPPTVIRVGKKDEEKLNKILESIKK